jgi:hypothetical protein
MTLLPHISDFSQFNSGLFLLGLIFGVCGNVFYFLIVAKLRSVGIKPPIFTSLGRMIVLFSVYSEMAPQKGWPRWWVTCFWASVALAFLAGLAFVYHLK